MRVSIVYSRFPPCSECVLQVVRVWWDVSGDAGGSKQCKVCANVCM